MKRRSAPEFESVLTLMEAGLGDSQIARRTGIPRGTISSWRHGRGTAYHHRTRVASERWRPFDAPAYCYLLGVYLGDGCLHVTASGAACLIVSLDSHYPAVVAEVTRAIETTLPGVRVRQSSVNGSAVAVLRASHPALPHVFPQHGAGRKHMRPIELREWQERLTSSHPRQLLRGLIHSDGCRTINRFSVELPSGRTGHYAYPRYFFSNLSSDIRGIFCRHCELIGVRWTQSNSRNISVSHRVSVALMDEFIGPKT